MTAWSSRQQEIRHLLIAINGGEATDRQLERLDALLREDRELAHYAAKVVDQQATLAQLELRGSKRTAAAPRVEKIEPRSTEAKLDRGFLKRTENAVLLKYPTVAIAVAFVLGAVLTFGIQNRRLSASRTPAVPNVAESQSANAYEARLVRTTACLWNSDSRHWRTIGSRLTSGESLHLLQGLADLDLQWSVGGNASLSLEGPAAMMLTAEGMPSLRFGRLVATITASHPPFVMDTPVGRVTMSEYGSLGVSAYGNDAEIHVFDGAAVLEPTWSSPGGMPQITIVAGEAIRVRPIENGSVTIERHKADEDYFTAQVSMNSDALLIPSRYVDTVKEGRPLGYWRFERSVWPEIPNEMGDEFPCHVQGSIGTVGHPGNQAIEFGVTDRSGEIHTTEALSDLMNDSYTIEFWIKPSHFHLGAVISLVAKSETPAAIIPHGLLLELGGSGRMPTATHHPGRIRFLHRSPAGNDASLGTSCYSGESYTLRKWQHVAAVKDGDAMRLYINGELVGENVDNTILPSGLRLLIGKLYPSRKARPFIGQLDELALYGRALPQEELRLHYRLVRSSDNASAGI